MAKVNADLYEFLKETSLENGLYYFLMGGWKFMNDKKTDSNFKASNKDVDLDELESVSGGKSVITVDESKITDSYKKDSDNVSLKVRVDKGNKIQVIDETTDKAN